MTSKTVTVQYVNKPKPGDKKGSIKTTEGEYWGVWADKINLYYPGAVVRIDDYDTYEAQSGKTYYTIKSGAIVGGERQQPQSRGNGMNRASGGGNTYTPERDRHIFVCGALNATFSNPNVTPTALSGADMAGFVRRLMQVYDQTLGPNAGKIQTSTGPAAQATKPPMNEELGDEIPF